MAAAAEGPILSRLDRIDNVLRQLEEIRGSNRTPKSSCTSTPSSGTLTSEGGQASSVDFSPRSIRPMDDVIVEVEHKGTLIERLVYVEDRILKLEAEFEAEKKRDEKKSHRKGLKAWVNSCVMGNRKHKGRAKV